MGMALKQDVVAAQKEEGLCRPIDLVHLSTQTMGDSDLEAEVLGVFESQSKIYMNLLKTSNDPVILHRAAHSLKGAALGVGAFSLAHEAKELELKPEADKTKLEHKLSEALEYVHSIIS